MVRIFAGTLIEIGLKKRSPEQIMEILAARDRKMAGFTAPAQGLYLARVIYPQWCRSDGTVD
jgi:tRNA pseudouridine38-40 synthase